MKKNVLFSSIIVAVLCIGIANAQITPPIQRVSLTESDNAILNQRISKYTAFTIDKKELTERLYAKGTCQFRLCIDESQDWTIELKLNDMRSPNYKATFIKDEGEFEIKEPFVLNTFMGQTSDGKIARFTIDDNTFFGVILGDDYHYVIRQTKDYTQNIDDNSFISYKSWDIIINDDYFDYINDALAGPNDGISQDMMSKIASSPCQYHSFRIATDADFEFHNSVGGVSATSTNNYITSILNIVEGVYEKTFGIKFVITFQNVYTSSASQPYISNDSDVLINSFRNYWNANRISVIRNIAHLFTGKTLIGSVVGKAWTGNINGNTLNNYAYSLSMYRLEMYQSTAHEIGHNFNAQDNPASCSCGTSSASVMCQGVKDPNLWFCTQSVNEINTFRDDNCIYLNVRNVCSGSPQSFTFNGWQSGYTWGVSSNLSLSSTTTNPTSVSAIGSGAGWVIVKNSSGTEIKRYIVWVGVPAQLPNLYLDAACFINTLDITDIMTVCPCDIMTLAPYPTDLRLRGVLEFEFQNSGNFQSFTGRSNDGQMTMVVPCIVGTTFWIKYRYRNSCGWSAWYTITGSVQNLASCKCYKSPVPPPGNTFKAYPNPTSDFLNVELNDPNRTAKQNPTYEVRLYDSLGNLKRNTQTNGVKVEFNMTNLPDGVYLLHIYDNESDTTEVHKIIVEH